MDDLLNLDGWQLAGVATVAEAPNSVTYVYQGLHGAVAATTEQMQLGLRLSTMRVRERPNLNRQLLCRCRELVGWPRTLGNGTTDAWQYLATAYGRWSWIQPLFQNETEYRVGLTAYYLAMNVQELAETLSREGTEWLEVEQHVDFLDVPLVWVSEEQTTQAKAAALVSRASDLDQAWEQFGVGREAMRAAWPRWIELCQRWIAEVFRHPPEPVFVYGNNRRTVVGQRRMQERVDACFARVDVGQRLVVVKAEAIEVLKKLEDNMPCLIGVRHGGLQLLPCPFELWV